MENIKETILYKIITFEQIPINWVDDDKCDKVPQGKEFILADGYVPRTGPITMTLRKSTSVNKDFLAMHESVHVAVRIDGRVLTTPVEETCANLLGMFFAGINDIGKNPFFNLIEYYYEGENFQKQLSLVKEECANILMFIIHRWFYCSEVEYAKLIRDFLNFCYEQEYNNKEVNEILFNENIRNSFNCSFKVTNETESDYKDKNVSDKRETNLG